MTGVKPNLRIGTSGWTYDHWRGVFYPEGHPKSRWLEYYCGHFDTVELNATFYRSPKPATFTNWLARTPEHFIWSVKASRFITHVKRLKDAEESIKRFYDSAGLLGDKLGPILFQLPPGLTYDEALLTGFLRHLNPSFRHAVEVRNKSWIEDDFFTRLRDHNVAFCMSDTAGRYAYHEAVTADFVYLRLHGSRKLYASEYTAEELATWAEKLRAWNLETYVYFDNDFEGHAVRNALQLKEIFHHLKPNEHL